MLTTRAPAKVNLTLRVLGRRSDGYHELSSLVAFAGVGDEVSADPALPLGLRIAGPFAAGLAADESNLVLKAVRHLASRRKMAVIGHLTLIKRLPVASGIGGGSADAAAALRLMARLNRIPIDDPDVLAAARETGADVPVCLQSRARCMSGTGEILGPVLALQKLFAVLVNPGIEISTAAVFNALGLQPGQTTAGPPAGKAEPGAENISGDLEAGRNDLEPAALRLGPVIGDVLAVLRAASGCQWARMSGSGATCYGIFANHAQSAAAAKAIKALCPDWWVKATVLR